VDASDQVVSLLVPSPLTTQPVDGLVLDKYQTQQGTVLSYDVPHISAGGTSFIDVPLTAPVSSGSVFTVRGQLSSGPAISALQTNASVATLNVSTATPLPTGGLLFGPGLFNSCSQPTDTCSACSTEWSNYQSYLNLAKNAENPFDASQKTFLLKGLLVGAEIARDAGIASGIGAIVSSLGAGLVVEGILTQTEAADFVTYMGALLKFIVKARQAGPNDPAEVLTQAGNATQSILQDSATATKIRNSRGIIKSAALQAKADSFLYGLDLITDTLQTLKKNASSLKAAWDERNIARDNYLNADKHMCAAANTYLQCASSKYGSNKTVPTPGYGDDLDFLLQTLTSLDPNEKNGPPGAGQARYVSGQQTFPYAISFENSQNATAPAQTVLLTDSLDATNFDVSSVMLGPLAIGGQVMVPPPKPIGIHALQHDNGSSSGHQLPGANKRLLEHRYFSFDLGVYGY
jgi:hypothetical protein